MKNGLTLHHSLNLSLSGGKDKSRFCYTNPRFRVFKVLFQSSKSARLIETSGIPTKKKLESSIDMQSLPEVVGQLMVIQNELLHAGGATKLEFSDAIHRLNLRRSSLEQLYRGNVDFKHFASVPVDLRPTLSANSTKSDLAQCSSTQLSKSSQSLNLHSMETSQVLKLSIPPL
jgi:hypothetical protein